MNRNTFITTNKKPAVKTKKQKLVDLAAQAQLLKYNLGEAGLFESMHKMDDVTSKMGWEIAEALKVGSFGFKGKILKSVTKA